MLLGLQGSPAVLPEDVERYFFSAYRPPQTPEGLPGHYVPPEVPEEVLRRVLRAYEADPLRAEDAAKIEAELAAREAYASDPGAYRPWTADRICTPCVAQGARAATGFRNMPWSWKGIRAIPDPQEPGLWYMTCGMLKDAGVIATQADCDRENAEAMSMYAAHIDRLERTAKTAAKKAFTRSLVISGVMAIVTFGAGAALGAATVAGVAATSALSLMTTAMNNPRFFTEMSLEQGLKLASQNLLALVPVVGGTAGTVIKMTVTTLESAKDFVDYLEQQEEISDALEAKRERIDSMMSGLDSLIRNRATFEELRAANEATQAAINDALAEKRARDRKWLVGGAVAALVAALFLGRS